ncbi:hypothetical protein BGX23_009356 [Mortierella sp. AD031]|nr:hypothetical protein BGX23_009356 [Mortierella sp. AD031]
MLEKKWKSQKRARQAERLEEVVDNKMRKLLGRAKYEHRAITLEHFSGTLAKDFLAYDHLPIAKHIASSTADLTLSSASVTSSTSSTSAIATITTTNTTTVAGEEQDMFFDPSTTETIMLRIAGVEVGASFRELQCKAASIVNDRNKKLTLERLPMFMACNYILHLDSELPGVDEDDMDKVRESLHVGLMSVSKETALLCCAFDEELAKFGRVRSKESDCEEETLHSLYQQL